MPSFLSLKTQVVALPHGTVPTFLTESVVLKCGDSHIRNGRTKRLDVRTLALLSMSDD